MQDFHVNIDLNKETIKVKEPLRTSLLIRGVIFFITWKTSNVYSSAYGGFKKIYLFYSRFLFTQVGRVLSEVVK